jgi:hypothetical protein
LKGKCLASEKAVTQAIFEVKKNLLPQREENYNKTSILSEKTKTPLIYLNFNMKI